MYNKGMKPMKVMRYGGTNRYNRSKPKSNKLLIAIIAGIVVVALAVVIMSFCASFSLALFCLALAMGIPIKSVIGIER